MGTEYYSDFLFARPSLIEGIARLMDFGNTLNEYNRSSSTSEADEVAISMDWKAVGCDLYVAINKYDQEEKEELTIATK